MSAAEPTTEEAVANTLGSGIEMTGAEIATATGLGRSTVGEAWPRSSTMGQSVGVGAVVTGAVGCRTGGRSAPPTSGVGQVGT